MKIPILKKAERWVMAFMPLLALYNLVSSLFASNIAWPVFQIVCYLLFVPTWAYYWQSEAKKMRLEKEIMRRDKEIEKSLRHIGLKTLQLLGELEPGESLEIRANSANPED